MTTVSGHHNKQEEIHLHQTKAQTANRCNHIEVRKLRWVIGIPAWHASQTQEVHWEESEVKENHGTPEMHFAAELIGHVASPFWTPEVKASKHRKEGAGYQHIMEVGDNVVGVLHTDINWGYCQNQACKSAHRKHENKANRPQHGSLECHRTSPHGCNPVKDFDAGRYCNQHGCIHKEQLTRHWHASSKHVVRPHDERQNRNRCSSVDHRAVTE